MTLRTKRFILPPLHGFLFGLLVVHPVAAYFDWFVLNWEFWVLVIAGNLPIPWLYNLLEEKNNEQN